MTILNELKTLVSNEFKKSSLTNLEFALRYESGNTYRLSVVKNGTGRFIKTIEFKRELTEKSISKLTDLIGRRFHLITY
jgi:hypothetical protein